MDEITKALLADGEKLRQLTGRDHGPVFMCDCGLPLVLDIEIAQGKCTFCEIAPVSSSPLPREEKP